MRSPAHRGARALDPCTALCESTSEVAEARPSRPALRFEGTCRHAREGTGTRPLLSPNLPPGKLEGLDRVPSGSRARAGGPRVSAPPPAPGTAVLPGQPGPQRLDVRPAEQFRP